MLNDFFNGIEPYALLTALGGALGVLIKTIFDRYKVKSESQLKLKELDLEDKKIVVQDKEVTLTNVNQLLSYMRDQVTALIDKVNDLQRENISIKEQHIELNAKYENLSLEKDDLIKKVELLEKTLLQSGIYKTFFDITSLCCAIIRLDNGKVINANNAFLKQYNYQKSDLDYLTAYDFSLEIDDTEKALKNKIEYSRSRLHKTKNGRAFFVEVYDSFYEFDGYEVCFAIFIPKVKIDLDVRIHDMLDEIIRMFDADYSLIWAIHNHGIDKISTVLESSRKGNAPILQDYKEIPLTIFSEVVNYFHETDDRHLIIYEDDEKFAGVKLIMGHAKLTRMIISPIFDDQEIRIIGLISATCKNECNMKVSEKQINNFIKFSKSDLIREVLESEYTA